MTAAIAMAAIAGIALSPLPAPETTGACSAPEMAASPPSYYAIELVPTRRVPGTGAAVGTGHVTFVTSPFVVSVAPGGSYLYQLDVRVEKLRLRPDAVFAVWVADGDLDEVRLLGTLDATLRVRGQVAWNKFLVVISLEASKAALGDRWQGPIVMRGMSRSGMMHTMAGHGAFEGEPCVKYGYK